MKQVFKRDMVAHLWANRSQDSARSPDGRFYFNGRALHSYGSHYVIGAHVETCDGSRILWNDAGYSVSTARHSRIARRALSGFQERALLRVDGLSSDDIGGRGWLLKLAQRVARDAGSYFDKAANVKRASLKRDEAAANASRQAVASLLLARTVAAGVGDAQGATAADKRAARRLVASLESLAPYPDDTDAQREVMESNARALIREEKKREIADRAAAAAASLDRAMQSREWGHYGTARSHANDSRLLADHAREMARTYKLRAPKLPDVSALLLELAPLARAEAGREAAARFRNAWKRAESTARRAGIFGHSAALRYAREAIGYANEAIANGHKIDGDALARVRKIERRQARADAMSVAAFPLSGIEKDVRNANDLRGAGEMRRAAKAYAEALRDTERALSVIPAGHPAWSEYPWLPGTPHGGRQGAEHYAAPLLRSRLAETRAAFAAEDAAALQAWRNNEPGASVRDAYGSAIALRISADGADIETSRGAVVPVIVAPRLWRLVNAARASGEARAFDGEGPRLGAFRLETVHASGGITAGCHDIEWPELAYIAGRLGLATAQAAAAE